MIGISKPPAAQARIDEKRAEMQEKVIERKAEDALFGGVAVGLRHVFIAAPDVPGALEGRSRSAPARLPDRPPPATRGESRGPRATGTSRTV